MKTRRIECTIDCLTCKDIIYTVYAIEDSARPGVWSHEREPQGLARHPLCKKCGETGDRVEPSKMVAGIRTEVH